MSGFGWTGELWSDHVVLILRKKIIFFCRKQIFFKNFRFFLKGFFKIFAFFDHFFKSIGFSMDSWNISDFLKLFEFFDNFFLLDFLDFFDGF